MSDTPANRRDGDRRRPMIVIDYVEGLNTIARTQYSGMFIGHAHNGVVHKIEIPNPAGWHDPRLDNQK